MIHIITILTIILSATGGQGFIDLDAGMALENGYQGGEVSPANSICRNPLFSPSFQLEARKSVLGGPRNSSRDSLNLSLIGEYNLGGNYINASGWAVAPFGNYILLSSGGGLIAFTKDSLRKVREISGRGFIWDFKVRGNLVYTASGDRGLAIFDLSSIESPRVLAQLDIPYNDPSNNEVFGWGATGIDLKDTFAYVTMRDAGLVVVNIANPYNPTIVGANTQFVGLMDVIIKDNVAFVTNYGPYNQENNGFIAYNISNPTNPVVISSISQMERGMHFFIKDSFAYVPTRWYAMEIVNIANPSNLRIVGNCSGGIYEAINVWVESFGDTTYAFISHLGTLLIYNVTNPSNTFRVATVNVHSTASYVISRRLYVQAPDGTALYDLTFPWSPQLINYFIYMVWPAHLTARDNYAYLYDEQTGYLRILDVSQPNNIRTISYFSDHLDSIPSNAQIAAIGGMYLEGSYVYLIVRGAMSWFCYMAIIDISDPYNPQWVGTRMWRGYAGGNRPCVEDSIAYVPTTLSGATYLRIINVANPSNISDIGILFFNGVALQLSKRRQDSLLYIAAGYFQDIPPWPQIYNDLRFASVARPWLPRMLNTFTTPRQCRAVVPFLFSQGRYLAIADGDGGARIINATNLAACVITGSFPIPGITEDVHVGINLAFACGDQWDVGRFISIKADDPNNPTLHGHYNLFPLISAKHVSAKGVKSQADSILLGLTGGGLFMFRTNYASGGLEEKTVSSIFQDFKPITNPLRNHIALSLNKYRDYSISLYDVTGRLRFNQKVEGKEQVEISVKGIRAGVYILHIQTGNDIYKKNIIITE